MKFSLLFYLVFATVGLSAQQREYKFSRLTQEDGLPHNIVHCIYQDYFGFLWFGTDNGICRYDGYEFKQLKPSAKFTGSFPNVYKAILQATDSVYWLGSMTGVVKYDYINDNIRIFTYSDSSETILDNEVYCLKEGPDRNIWIGTRYGLSIYNPGEDRWTSHRFNEDDIHDVSDLTINDIIFDEKGNAWIATSFSYLYYFNVDKGILKKIKLKNKDPRYPNIQFTRIYHGYLLNNVLWLATNMGLIKFDTNTEIFTYFNFESEKVNQDGLDLEQIAYHNGTFWIASNQGLLHFDVSDGSYTFYNAEFRNSESLATDILISLFIDRAMTLWIGTQQAGLNFVSLDPKKFKTYQPLLLDEPFASQNIYAVYQDSAGTIWTGSFNGILEKRDNNDQTAFKVFSGNKVVPREVIISDIAEDSKHNLWIGSMRLWMAKVNKKTLESISIRRDEEKPHGLGVYSARDLLIDEQDRLWITSIDRGFDVTDLKKYNYNPEKLVYEHSKEFYNKSGLLPSESLLCIEKENDSIVWLGTKAEGLIRLNYVSKTFKQYTSDIQSNTRLTNNHVNSIRLSRINPELIYVATDNGFNILNKDKEECFYLTTSDGLPSEVLMGILEHDNGDVWISSAYGLSCVKHQSGDIQNFFISDGLPSNEFNQRACFRNPVTGEMFFAGNRGFISFYPDSIEIDSTTPKVILTGLYINNTRYDHGDTVDGLIVLKTPVELTKKLVLSHNNNDISIEFSALTYQSTDEIKYRYQLKNYDNQVNEIGNLNRRVTYTNLSPGRYWFIIRASNTDGIWSDISTELEIIIEPPFYQEVWFIVILSFFFLAFIYLLYRFRTRNLILKKRILEKLVNERTIELQKSYEILAQKQDEILEQNDELAAQKETLNIVNANLVRTTDEIHQKNIELDKYKAHLEQLVVERTFELEMALKKAEESNRLKSAFLANMSHEFRTPMNAIIGFSNLLDEDGFKPEEKSEFISRIQNNGDLLLTMVNSILDLAKIQTGQLELFFNKVVISDLLNEIFRFFQRKYNSSTIKYSLHIEESLKNKEIFTDPLRLRQILENIIDNAFKFTTNGFIKIRLFYVDQKANISIEDSGVGIEDEYHTKIYEHFVKFESPSRLYRGSGLGLSIAKGLADLLKYRLWHESKPGEGTTFFLSFENTRIMDSDANNQISSDSNIPDLSGCNVLIAEDEEINFKLLEIYLKKTNAKIFYARDGIEAIALFDSDTKFDLILLDIKMPGKGGIEVVKHIRKKDKKIPVIAETAFAQSEEEIEIMKHGFNFYIRKPIARDDLFQKINQALNQ